MKVCLSIAGSDSSGGAGIQADLKTFSAWGCYGMTVLTALTAQNTQGVKGCEPVSTQMIQGQLEAVFSDIKPDAIKIGMLFSESIIHCVSNFLKDYAEGIPIVLDPVMVAKSGDHLLRSSAIKALKEELIPLASLLTPNLPEADALVGESEHLESQAHALIQLGCSAVLLKGGHLSSPTSEDYLLTKTSSRWLSSERIASKNVHGTGCTLSSAITAGLALGLDMEASCLLAKRYISAAIRAAEQDSVGQGYGPLHHFYHLWPTIQTI